MDGEEEALRDAVVEEWPNSGTGGREPFDEGETGLSQGDPVGEVMLGVESRGQPVAEPPNHPRVAKDKAVQGDRWLGEGGPLAWGPPVDMFCFGGGEFELQPVPFSCEGAEAALEAAYIGSV